MLLNFTNFKALKNVQINLANNSLLIGSNGYGKSSVFKAINFIKEYINHPTDNKFLLSYLLSGDASYKTTTYNNLKNHNSIRSEEISLGFSFKQGEMHFIFKKGDGNNVVRLASISYKDSKEHYDIDGESFLEISVLNNQHFSLKSKRDYKEILDHYDDQLIKPELSTEVGRFINSSYAVSNMRGQQGIYLFDFDFKNKIKAQDEIGYCKLVHDELKKEFINLLKSNFSSKKNVTAHSFNDTLVNSEEDANYLNMVKAAEEEIIKGLSDSIKEIQKDYDNKIKPEQVEISVNPRFIHDFCKHFIFDIFYNHRKEMKETLDKLFHIPVERNIYHTELHSTSKEVFNQYERLVHNLQKTSCLTDPIHLHKMPKLTAELDTVWRKWIDDIKENKDSVAQIDMNEILKPTFMDISIPLSIKEKYPMGYVYRLLSRQDSYYNTPLSFDNIELEYNQRYSDIEEESETKTDVSNTNSLSKIILDIKKGIKKDMLERVFEPKSPSTKVSGKVANKILKEHANLLKKELYNPYEKYFSMLFSSRKEYVRTIRAYFFLMKYLQKFKIAENIGLFKIEHIHRFLLESGSKAHRMGMKDIGYGNQQLLTLLIYITLEIADGKEDKYIIIEEPEANLHPNRQVELVDMLIDYQKEFGVKFILETHSENILRRYQILIAKGELSSEDLNIVFFRGKGQSEDIKINDSGLITVPFGEDFYNKSTNQKLELMEHLRNSTSKRK